MRFDIGITLITGSPVARLKSVDYDNVKFFSQPRPAYNNLDCRRNKMVLGLHPIRDVIAAGEHDTRP